MISNDPHVTSSNNSLKYTDFKGVTHTFTPKNDEVMVGYQSTTDSEGFLDTFGPGVEKVPEEDTKDTEYSYARVNVLKPNSLDNFSSLLKPKFPVAKYIPVMEEIEDSKKFKGEKSHKLYRYFLPLSFVLRIKKTSTSVIKQAEDTGTVLGYKIIRKYPFKSNEIGGESGEAEDDPVTHVRKSGIVNDNYGFYVVRLPPSPSGEKTEETLFRILRENNGTQKPDDVEYAEVDEVLFKALRYTPNDPEFPNQWGFGTGNGARVTQAWDDFNNRGHQNVVIAVLDSGLRTSHADFKYRAGETPATLVINAYNVLDGTSDVSHTGTDPKRYHGTWVAGVCSARVNNIDYGVAGIAWKCRITPVKICTGDTIVTSNAEAGINYVIGKAAEFPSRKYIILAAWDTAHNASFQNTCQNANATDILLIAASGDYNQDITVIPRYPVVYPFVRGGGALQSSGGRWSLSNYGVDVIMAPGKTIMTTDGPNDTATINKDGTSYGAAFLAGAAALVWGRDKNLNGTFKRTNTAVMAEIDAALAPGDAGYPNKGKLRIDQATTFSS